MGGTDIVAIISVAACLVLALRAYRSHGFSFEQGAWMAAVWAAIIAALALVIEQLRG